MSVPFVDLHQQYLSIKSAIDAAIADVIAHSSFVRGPHVEAFEANYRKLMGVKHCVSCANGTDALFIAMRALGAGPGDEVITTAHSWISTSETITLTGARVAFVDTEESSFNINPDLIEAAINERTKGLVVVHLYGQPADMDRILDSARRHNLWVIEDCAQAHLATYKGAKVGTFGDAATFSFYPGKNLGAMGDAGCLVTNSDRLQEYAALFARHGGKGNHVMEGINSRLDGLQAAILNVKLEHIEKWTQMRQAAADRYDALFASVPGVRAPQRRDDVDHVFHLYVIRVANRDGLRAHLNERGIGSVINYSRALPHYQAYAYLGHSETDFPVAKKHSEEILSIPMFPEITEAQQREVVNAIAEFVG